MKKLLGVSLISLLISGYVYADHQPGEYRENNVFRGSSAHNPQLFSPTGAEQKINVSEKSHKRDSIRNANDNLKSENKKRQYEQKQKSRGSKRSELEPNHSRSRSTNSPSKKENRSFKYFNRKNLVLEG